MTARFACFVDGGREAALTMPPQNPSVWDQGAACVGAMREEWRHQQLSGCIGCAARLRAILIERGEVARYGRVRLREKR